MRSAKIRWATVAAVRSDWVIGIPGDDIDGSTSEPIIVGSTGIASLFAGRAIGYGLSLTARRLEILLG
jgi:hypothetical protein